MADIERREKSPLLDALAPKVLAIFDFQKHVYSVQEYDVPPDLMRASQVAVREIAKERSLDPKSIYTELRSGSDIEQQLLDDLIRLSAPDADPQSEEYFEAASSVILERYVREHYF